MADRKERGERGDRSSRSSNRRGGRWALVHHHNPPSLALQRRGGEALVGRQQAEREGGEGRGAGGGEGGRVQQEVSEEGGRVVEHALDSVHTRGHVCTSEWS